MQNKKIVGVFYVLTFASLLTGFFFVGNRGISPSGALGLIKSKFKSLFQVTTQQYLIKQPVIEEESAIVSTVEKVSPTVVSVVEKTVKFDPFNGPVSSQQGIGTGFIVEADGLIVTNNHVVSDTGADYSVVLKDGATYDVKKIYRDTLNDIALIQVSAKDLPTVEIGDSANLKVGQTAIAIGNALGQFSNTVTVGVVSGLSRQVTASGPFGTQPQTYNDVIQTDAAINPGNSGGPLLNIAGQVIGINVATSSDAENISFAIAINRLKPVLNSYKESGRIIRPYIGISFSMVTKDVAAVRRLPEGAYITKVLPDTPASRVGLERGDIITKVNKDLVNEKNPLDYEIQQNFKVGDTVTLTVDRQGQILTLTVTLEEAPAK